MSGGRPRPPHLWSGETMSPTFRAVPGEGSDPISQAFVERGGGTNPGDGLTKRVTSTVCPVLRTFSSSARQAALNFEIAISSMESLQERIGQRPSSQVDAWIAHQLSGVPLTKRSSWHL